MDNNGDSNSSESHVKTKEILTARNGSKNVYSKFNDFHKNNERKRTESTYSIFDYTSGDDVTIKPLVIVRSDDRYLI